MFLYALEILFRFLFFLRQSQVITVLVYLWSWSISTHMTAFLIQYFLLQVSKTVILDLGETCLFHTKTNPKEIGADISIFLGSSVLYWHIVK